VGWVNPDYFAKLCWRAPVQLTGHIGYLQIIRSSRSPKCRRLRDDAGAIATNAGAAPVPAGAAATQQFVAAQQISPRNVTFASCAGRSSVDAHAARA
jgi:hypothetical protein